MRLVAINFQLLDPTAEKALAKELFDVLINRKLSIPSHPLVWHSALLILHPPGSHWKEGH